MKDTQTIFWNVDTQFDFMRNDDNFAGALAVDGAREIEENLMTLTGLASKLGKLVVNTADWHTASSKEFSDSPDYINTFPPHCMQNTKGAAYVPATAPENAYVVDWQKERLTSQEAMGENVKRAIGQEKDLIIYKDAFDVFTGNSFAGYLVEEVIRPERAVVYGVAANVCVDEAVKGLRARGVEVLVPTDAIKELPGSLEDTLNGWKELDVKLITTAEVEEYLR